MTGTNTMAVSFWVAKGGTGKTTTCGNVGHAMARHGHRVLMVDADPQGNLSSWFLTAAPDYELADVLTGRCKPLKASVSLRPNLWLIPTFGLGGGLSEWADTKAPAEPFAIADLIEKLRPAFDVILFDIGPGTSAFGQVVNSAVDTVVPVVLPEYFSVDGLEIFNDYMESIRTKRRSTAKPGPVVINRVDLRQATHKRYMELGEIVIGQSTDISDATIAHQTVFEFAKHNRFAHEYERLGVTLWHSDAS